MVIFRWCSVLAIVALAAAKEAEEGPKYGADIVSIENEPEEVIASIDLTPILLAVLSNAARARLHQLSLASPQRR